MTCLLVLLFKYGVRKHCTDLGLITTLSLMPKMLQNDTIECRAVTAVHQSHLWLHGICWVWHLLCSGWHNSAAADRQGTDPAGCLLFCFHAIQLLGELHQ